jgi:acid phosphatase
MATDHGLKKLVTYCAAGMSAVLAACSSDNITNTPARLAPAVAAERAYGHDRGPIRGFQRLKHVVVIYLENHSFDNLYGEFPGADGLDHARNPTQVSLTGVPFDSLPTPPGGAFPSGLANAPFSIEQYVSISAKTPDLVHRFYQEQIQIDGGKMDRFAAVSDARGLVMGYYHTANLPLATEASQYTLCDHFFHAAFGGSFLNHIWLIAAQTPVFPGAPTATVAVLDPGTGLPTVDGFVTSDGYAVNTAFTVNRPHPATVPTERLVPNQTFPTIGDRLTEAGVSWAWYSGGWNDALAGHPDPLFQFHHQPFAYFANYADGTQAKADHLRDETEFLILAQAGKLPAVSFVKPLGEVNEHPGYTDVLSGEMHVKQLIDAIRNGPDWEHTAIIITYDEHGGFWDHVPPPVVDRWGPGARVPTLIISPFARRGYVDHHHYDTTSILALIERRWHLKPLGTRDANINDLTPAFDFERDRPHHHDGHAEDDDDAR